MTSRQLFPDCNIELHVDWLAYVTMGNADTKLNFRKAVVQLTSRTQVSYGRYLYVYHINKAIFVTANGDS
jgi:hypothetical protein